MPRTQIQHSFRFTNSQVSIGLNACVHGALRLSFQRSQEKGKAGFQARGKFRGGEEGAVVKIFGFALAILLFKLLATTGETRKQIWRKRYAYLTSVQLHTKVVCQFFNKNHLSSW